MTDKNTVEDRTCRLEINDDGDLVVSDPPGGYIEDGPHSMRADTDGSDTLEWGDGEKPIGDISPHLRWARDNGLVVALEPGGVYELPTIDDD